MPGHGSARLAPVDLHDPSVFAAGVPHGAFAAMRAEQGLTWSPPSGDDETGFWSVAKHQELVAVSRDTTTYSSAVGHIQMYDIDEDALAARASMIDLDPPIHTRLRRLVSAAFTPKHVEDYRAAVRARVVDCLDRLAAAGGGDWVDLVAAPIPIGVICDLVGVPEADHGYMIELSDHLVAGTGATPPAPDAYGNTTDLRLLPFNSPAASAMARYALELCEQRRRLPTGDLISKLIEAEVDGERLTDDELANFFRLLIFAGNETTRSSMAHLAVQMSQFPDVFAAGTADRTLLPAIADEVIRYSSPILYFRRTVTEDTVLSGTELAAGDKVVMWYASANFDEEVFDRPLQFRADRPQAPTHVAFGGGGAHFCLGASLARLELVELLDEMADRRWRFQSVGSPRFVESNFVNGIESLEVSLALQPGSL